MVYINLNFKNMDFQGGHIEASISRYLTPYFNLQFTTGVLSLERGKYENYMITSKNYWYFDLVGQVKFLGGVIKENAILTPYLYFELGDQLLNEENDIIASVSGW